MLPFFYSILTEKTHLASLCDKYVFMITSQELFCYDFRFRDQMIAAAGSTMVPSTSRFSSPGTRHTKIKTKDNPPTLPPSLKLRWSKKASVDKESKKTKVKR